MVLRALFLFSLFIPWLSSAQEYLQGKIASIDCDLRSRRTTGKSWLPVKDKPAKGTQILFLPSDKNTDLIVFQIPSKK